MKFSSIFLLATVFVFYACSPKDEEPLPAGPCAGMAASSAPLAVRWTVPVSAAQATGFFMWPEDWQGQLLYWYGEPGQQTLAGRDAATGVLLWEMPSPATLHPLLVRLVAGKFFFIEPEGQDVHCIDLTTRTSSIACNFSSGWLSDVLVQRNDLLLFAHTGWEGGSDTLQSRLFLLDGATGAYRVVHQLRKASLHSLGYEVMINPLVDITAAGDTVLAWLEVLEGQGGSPSDGARFFVWHNLTRRDSGFSRLTLNSISPYNRAFTQDGRFVYELEQMLHAFSSETGEVAWRVAPEPVPVVVHPRLVPGGVLVFSWTYYTLLHPADGRTMWQQPRGTFSFVPDNGIARPGANRYFLVDDVPGKIIVLDLESGCIIGEHDLPRSPAGRQPLTGLSWSADGRMVFFSDAQHTWAVELP